jgi:hypothetical protein
MRDSPLISLPSYGVILLELNTENPTRYRGLIWKPTTFVDVA